MLIKVKLTRSENLDYYGKDEIEIDIEEYLKGEEYSLISMWDGKSLLHFDTIPNMTEVQEDRLNLYKTKLTLLCEQFSQWS